MYTYYQIKPFVRKSKENRVSYEAILERSQARFPDETLPHTVNFDSEIDVGTLQCDPSTSIESECNIKNEGKMTFEQLYKKAIQQRFVSADEMKFLILVEKFIVRRKDTKCPGNQYISLSVLGFT